MHQIKTNSICLGASFGCFVRTPVHMVCFVRGAFCSQLFVEPFCFCSGLTLKTFVFGCFCSGAGLICTLRMIGWRPLEANRWEDPEGTLFDMLDSPIDVGQFFEHVHRTIVKKMWKKAAMHRHGAGCEEGAELGAARTVIRSLKKKGKVEEAGLATTIVAAGLWPAQRKKEAGYYVGNGLCRLCGMAEDSEQHRLWECSFWNRDSGKEMKATWHLEDQARGEEGWKKYPAFWLQGIIPKTKLSCCEASERKEVFARDELIGKEAEAGTMQGREIGKRIASSNLTWYIDESGGRYAECKRQRRCGWGLAALPSREGTEYSKTELVGGLRPTYQASIRSPCVPVLMLSVTYLTPRRATCWRVLIVKCLCVAFSGENGKVKEERTPTCGSKSDMR